VGECTPGRHELIANLAWEGDVCVAVAVQVPQLAPAEVKLDTEAVDADLDVGPGSEAGADAGGRAGPIDWSSRSGSFQANQSARSRKDEVAVAELVPEVAALECGLIAALEQCFPGGRPEHLEVRRPRLVQAGE
jgi:hypothetical protein